MRYNLASNSLITTNTDIGNKSLTLNEVNYLTNGNFDNGVYLSGDDILCIDVDLGYRIKISDIRYYITTSGISLDDIEFYYKDEFNDSDYIKSTTDSGTNYFYTVISGVSAPRYLRMLHTVSGTTSSGILYGIEITNYEDYVDFGTDGNKTQEYVSLSVGTSNISTIPVYNNDSFLKTAYVQIEPSYNKMDEVLFISDNINGPWISIVDESSILHDGNNWSSGVFSSNTTVLDNNLQLSYLTEGLFPSIKFDRNDVGIYTTKIFRTNDDNFNSLYIKDINRLIGVGVSVDEEDTVLSYEIRSYNRKPMDLSALRFLYNRQYDTNRHAFRFKDVSTFDNSTELLSSTSDIYVFGSYLNSLLRYYVNFNINNRYTSGIASTSEGVALFLLNNDDSSSNRSSATLYDYNGNTIDLNIYKCVTTKDGGTWFYLYIRTDYHTDYLNNTGYYFCHFNSALSSTFKLYNSAEFMKDFDIVYDSNYAWITDHVNARVNKITSVGDSLVSIASENTTNLGAIAATSDGGCWFSDGNNLVRLDSNGNQIGILYDIGSTGVIHKIICDGEDALWYREYSLINRILITEGSIGRPTSSVYITDADNIFISNEGLWVYSLGYMYLVSRGGEVIRTCGSSSPTYQRIPGVIFAEYDTTGYEYRFPISYDTVWNNLTYKKVLCDSYTLPKEAYSQIKMTLRTFTPYKSYDDIVDYNEVWSEMDSFDYKTENKPSVHRWTSTDYVTVDSGKCMFNATGGSFTKYITSYDKWYFKHPDYASMGGSACFDYQIDYEIPSSNLSSEVRIEMYFTPYPRSDKTTYTESNSYHKAILIRRSSEVIIQVAAAGLSSYSSYEKWVNVSKSYTIPGLSGVVGSGKIRYRVEGYNVQAYHWDDTTEVWVGTGWLDTRRDGSYPLNFYYQPNLYFKLKATNMYDIYFDNFKFNEYGSGNFGIYWYNVKSPSINGLYYRKSLSLKVYPKSYSNIYLKTDIPNYFDFESGAIFNNNLKVWWENEI